MLQHKYIYIDGIDGSGKSTIVNMLRSMGYTNVFDRSILTTLSIIPISKLPANIIPNSIIINQYNCIMNKYPGLKTNRDIMTKLDPYATYNPDICPDNIGTDVIYIIFDASVDTCTTRLENRANTGLQLNGFDSEPSIRYFKSKYLYLAHKYNIPVINTDNKTIEQVYQLVCSFINDPGTNAAILGSGHITGPITIMLDNVESFSPHLLELEWISLGKSKIIYADNTKCICTDNISVKLYQDNIAYLIAEKNLNEFIHSLRE